MLIFKNESSEHCPYKDKHLAYTVADVFADSCDIDFGSLTVLFSYSSTNFSVLLDFRWRSNHEEVQNASGYNGAANQRMTSLEVRQLGVNAFISFIQGLLNR
jgi:hypothetical protein